ncbi:DUF6318 family protein [Ancrocorticia populi]|uniref:DUF6318 domain-containing protein n=1 Tax=Ancrocorticia populi TaxID=2175228 RepID=A0A2V1JZJ6_9ACTO|nr:DUF6318 family protein [Ancrocorticia populi]PWF24444.1 hypothetical protein DD236_11565 [Ancrocorticia populi]
MGHNGRALAGLLIALLMGLAGCGDGNPATPTSQATAVQPSPTATSAVPTKPTGIEPPQKPAAMSTPDEDGAVAAAEYFLRMTTYAAATGDTTELEAMSGPDCQFCESYLESVTNMYSPEKGNAWATMPEITIEYSTVRPTEEKHQFQVEMRTQKGEFDYYNELNGLQHGDEETLVMAVVATHVSDNTWRVEVVQDFPEDTKIPGEDS